MQAIRDTFAQEETTSQNHSKGFSDIDDYLKAMLHLHRDFALTAASFFLNNLIWNRAEVFRYYKVSVS